MANVGECGMETAGSKEPGCREACGKWGNWGIFHHINPGLYSGGRWFMWEALWGGVPCNHITLLVIPICYTLIYIYTAGHKGAIMSPHQRCVLVRLYCFSYFWQSVVIDLVVYVKNRMRWALVNLQTTKFVILHLIANTVYEF